MKEYRVEMKVPWGDPDKWYKGRRPNWRNNKTYTELQDARNALQIMIDRWDERAAKGLGDKPTEWRIVSREVTEWEVAE